MRQNLREGNRQHMNGNASDHTTTWTSLSLSTSRRGRVSPQATTTRWRQCLLRVRSASRMKWAKMFLVSRTSRRTRKRTLPKAYLEILARTPQRTKATRCTTALWIRVPLDAGWGRNRKKTGVLTHNWLKKCAYAAETLWFTVLVSSFTIEVSSVP